VFFNKKILRYTVLVLLLAGGGFGYLLITRPEVKTTKPLLKRWLVAVETLHPNTYTPYVMLYGKVESLQTADLEVAITADVLERPIKEGQTVKKGQLLVRLDDREAQFLLQERQAEVNELKAEITTEHDRDASDQEALKEDKALLALAEKTVARWEHLQQKNAGSVAQLDAVLEELRLKNLAVNQREMKLKDHKNRITELEASVQKLQALQAQAELDVERTQIFAPFSGVVTKVYIAVGERVQSGEKLVRMFDDHALEIRAQIPTQYLPMIKQAIDAGKKLRARGNSEHQHLTLVLDRLAGEVDPGRAGVDGLFKVLKGGQRLALGRTVTIYLNLPPQANTYAIPMEALYGSDTIYKVVEEHLVAVKIKRIGVVKSKKQQEPRLLIRSDALSAGDTLVISQLPNAISGLPVRIDQESLP
jgi:multidrug efflux pump subunit AcrA (membrane-fusion protein)